MSIENKKFYVYIHFKADSLIPFYIGKGVGSRYKDGVRRNQYWHNVVKKHGFVPDILEYFENEQDAFGYEKEMIKFFRENGFNLVNLTDGGEGVSGFKHSEEARAKMREMRAGEGNVMFGKTHTEETKAKISEAHKGMKYPPRSSEYRQKISVASKGRKMSAEAKSKLSKLAKERVGDKSNRFKGVVVATNILTGEVIRLCGRKEMVAAKFSPSCICLCLQGKKKQYKGFTFKREQLEQHTGGSHA